MPYFLKNKKRGVALFKNFLKTLFYQRIYKVVHKIFKKWTSIVVHLFEIYGGIICPFFAEKWICYMPMILDFMERLEVHDLLKIGYITCPFFLQFMEALYAHKKRKYGFVRSP